ncbi:MAG: class I mannose-6-phosphate isomerase [Pirellulales bacterium]
MMLAVEPGSLIYAGLKRGFDRAALEREVNRGTSDLCLHRFEPQVGDCLFLPAGVVHAPGGGLLIAEIQQASDTTFRLFDWNRTGPDGKPRQLHIEQGLAAIDYAAGPRRPQTSEATDDPHVERLVTCDKFVLERVTLAAGDTWKLVNDDRFRIVAVVAGDATAAGESLPLGTTCLVPACLNSVDFIATRPTTLLTAYLP